MNLLYFSYNGVSVFHNYKDDDPYQCVLTYWFTLLENGGQEASFDVRSLPGVSADDEPYNYQERDAWIEATICRAIERGEVPGQVPTAPIAA